MGRRARCVMGIALVTGCARKRDGHRILALQCQVTMAIIEVGGVCRGQKGLSMS